MSASSIHVYTNNMVYRYRKKLWTIFTKYIYRDECICTSILWLIQWPWTCPNDYFVIIKIVYCHTTHEHLLWILIHCHDNVSLWYNTN